MKYIFWDVETKSTVDLSDIGAYKYATDPTTEILCVGYATDAGPIKIWHPGDPVPKAFLEAARHPQNYACVVHNFGFEQNILRNILAPRYGWPVLPVGNSICTMATARALALPASLGKLARALNLPHQKDSAGNRLMLQMMKPRKPTKDEDPEKVHWFADAERMAKLDAYCKDDVATTREAFWTMPPLSEEEQALWVIDQRINDRGIAVDVELAKAASKIAAEAYPRLHQEMARITDGEVNTIDEVAKLTAWLQKHEASVASVDKKALEELLKNDRLPPKARRAIELRREGAQAAVKKVDALLARVEDDGRLRGAFAYHAASTGRWSSHGLQVHNLKRIGGADIDKVVKAIQKGRTDIPLSEIGNTIRAMLWAGPGKQLVGADFSGIEARVNAWLAGETSKIEVFKQFDAGKGPDPYIVAAMRIFRKEAADISPFERQTGKGAELALGFGGTRNSLLKFLPEGHTFDEAEIESIIRRWREAHPNIVAFWRALGNAAVKACRHPGETIGCFGRLTFYNDESYLWLTLPSGRSLAYPDASIKNTFETESGHLVTHTDKGYPSIVFRDNANGQWTEKRVWFGLLCENVVQATARDLLAEAIVRLENNGLPVVGHVHDEIFVEVPAKANGAVGMFSALMTEVPAWADGLPVVAKSWAAQRYVK